VQRSGLAAVRGFAHGDAISLLAGPYPAVPLPVSSHRLKGTV